MVNFYVFFKDYSAAAKGDEKYHGDYTRELVKRFKSDVEKIKEEESVDGEATESEIIYITWETYCYHVKEEEIYSQKVGWTLKGMGGRLDEAISFLHGIFCSNSGKNTIKLLYLMTKNKVGNTDVGISFAMNEGAPYENFVFHAFHDDVSKLDLSIASSFLKKRCAVYRNFELIDEADISGEFDYDKINVNNFATEKNQLKSYIKLKFINKFKHFTIVLKELNKLKKLQLRLLKESQKRNSLNVGIDKFMTALITYVESDKNDYSFDALKIEVEINNLNEEKKESEEKRKLDPILEDDNVLSQMIQNKFDFLENNIFQKTKNLVKV